MKFSKSIIAALIAALLSPTALAQTPASQFPTPKGTIVPGGALLVPWGPSTDGTTYQVGPPTQTHPLPISCPDGTINCFSGGGGTPANVNVSQIAGATVATGNGTAAGSLRVSLPTDGTGVLGLNAGTNLIGATMVFKRYDVTATVQNASYVSGNDLGGLISFTLDRTASGLLQSVGIQFVGGAVTAINAVCFDSNPTGSTFTDKSTFTIAAADQAKKINKSLISLTPVAQTGDTVTAASIDNYAQPFNSTGTIYCAYVATGTFTPATTTDMRVNIKVAQSAQ